MTIPETATVFQWYLFVKVSEIKKKTKKPVGQKLLVYYERRAQVFVFVF